MFQKNKIRELTHRALIVQPEVVRLSTNDTDYVSRSLNVILPDDLIETSKVYDYAYLGRFEFFSFCYKGYSGVVEETLTFRKTACLPNRYMVLSDMGDAGIILIETQDSPDKPSPVIWCDLIPDFFNLCEGKPMEQNPTIWPSFTDFFEYLVEQEEAKHTKE
jgi:hypothetical protein